MRQVRARKTPAGVLVLAASVFLLAQGERARAQFPIRQMPGARAGGVGSRESGVGRQVSNHPQSVSPPLPAVARIVVPEKDGVSFGSGTLIDARGQFGLVVTNWHVVRDAAGQISVEFPEGFKSPAQVVKTDKDWDLAALSIYRPRAEPMTLTAAAPQPGEELVIAGYGGGDWQMSHGRCTQYLAPGVEFPHELVELAAEARQGDSGGPILNQRGELAGVLFGSGPGYTSGSYGGRVLNFLSTVVPGGAPGNDGLPASSTSPGHGLAAAPPNTVPPQSTALHEFKPPSFGPKDSSGLTPALKPTNEALLAPPPRREVADRFGPRPGGSVADDVDPRVAVSPSRLDFGASPFTENSSAFASSPFAPNDTSPARGVDLEQAPPEQLLAAIWTQVGGVTLFDQTKTVLAMIGTLAIVVVFFRFGGQKEREHEDE